MECVRPAPLQLCTRPACPAQEQTFWEAHLSRQAAAWSRCGPSASLCASRHVQRMSAAQVRHSAAVRCDFVLVSICQLDTLFVVYLEYLLVWRKHQISVATHARSIATRAYARAMPHRQSPLLSEKGGLSCGQDLLLIQLPPPMCLTHPVQAAYARAAGDTGASSVVAQYLAIPILLVWHGLTVLVW